MVIYLGTAGWAVAKGTAARTGRIPINLSNLFRGVETKSQIWIEILQYFLIISDLFIFEVGFSSFVTIK